MTRYAVLNDAGSVVLSETDLDSSLIAKWVAESNPKATVYRLLVIDAQPVPNATQNIVSAGYVIEPTQVRVTWALAEKTADQIEAESLQAEKQQIQADIDAIQAQLNISNADRALLTNAQRINELERDTRVTMKAVKFLLRQAKRGV